MQRCQCKKRREIVLHTDVLRLERLKFRRLSIDIRFKLFILYFIIYKLTLPLKIAKFVIFLDF